MRHVNLELIRHSNENWGLISLEQGSDSNKKMIIAESTSQYTEMFYGDENILQSSQLIRN